MLCWWLHYTVCSEDILYSVRMLNVLLGNGGVGDPWSRFIDCWQPFKRQCFRFGHCINTGVQSGTFPAPVPSGKAIFALKRTAKLLLKAPSGCIHFPWWKEKSIEKVVLRDWFLRNLVSATSRLKRFFSRNMDLQSPPFMMISLQYTDRQTGRQLKVRGPYRRLCSLSVIMLVEDFPLLNGHSSYKIEVTFSTPTCRDLAEKNLLQRNGSQSSSKDGTSVWCSHTCLAFGKDISISLSPHCTTSSLRSAYWHQFAFTGRPCTVTSIVTVVIICIVIFYTRRRGFSTFIRPLWLEGDEWRSSSRNVVVEIQCLSIPISFFTEGLVISMSNFKASHP